MKKIRTYAIVDYLKQKKYCTIEELTKHFEVSAATIYRDIAELASRDIVRKVHGGIAFQDHSPDRKFPMSHPFQERINCNYETKQLVAEEALKRICENDILFLDSSTTVYYLAKLLENTNFSSLTIVTNSVMIIQNFYKYPSHYVRIGLGGSFDVQLNAFLGQATLRELEYLEISKAFVSSFGVDEGKVTTNHEYHAGLLMKVLEIARQKYLLIDRSKLKRNGLFKVISSRAFDELITN